MKPITVRIEPERLEQFITDMNRVIATISGYTGTSEETYKYTTSTHNIEINVDKNGDYIAIIKRDTQT